MKRLMALSTIILTVGIGVASCTRLVNSQNSRQECDKNSTAFQCYEATLSEIRLMNQELQTKLQELESVRNEVKLLNEKLGNATNKLEQNFSKISNNREQMNQNHQDLSNSVQGLNTRIQSLKANQDNLDQELDNLANTSTQEDQKLGQKISNIESGVNQRISNEVQTLSNKLQGLTTNADKTVVQGNLLINGNRWDGTRQEATTDRSNDAFCPEGHYVVGARAIDTDGGRYCVSCISRVKLFCRQL
ncbi:MULTISPECIES: hypothetical protein [unclassified Moorena]|uniref:hypothetical protein n=1 Tax=unclassified Moorena TaxID=2683338 RepID=UPI0013CDC661|nr:MULTISPECIES: hypothetical protein [unclassified Moorena]NEO18943.1 hypothetical protein [Moorena sp. SIO4A5]NEQ56146.1 hypothetical protein [Moorena sp. SIO4A1]